MCGLLTKQLEDALSNVPFYSQDGLGKEAIFHAIFALGVTRWFILEGEREGNVTILYGIVVGLMEDEYEYISLKELSEIELDLQGDGTEIIRVRQKENFKPTPLKNICDNRLQRFLVTLET